jgi:hypothetical protein
MPARPERRPTSPPTLIPGAQARRTPIAPDSLGGCPRRPPVRRPASHPPPTGPRTHQNQRSRARRRPALEVRTSPSPTEGLLCNCHLARPRRCQLSLYARHRRSRWWSRAAPQAPQWRRSLVVHRQARGRRSRIRRYPALSTCPPARAPERSWVRSLAHARYDALGSGSVFSTRSLGRTGFPGRLTRPRANARLCPTISDQAACGALPDGPSPLMSFERTLPGPEYCVRGPPGPQPPHVRWSNGRMRRHG